MVRTGDEVIAGQTYHVYTLNGATLKVLDGITVGNVITGTENDDTLIGTAGIDVIRAEAGNDFIDGAGGSDILRGGAGDDRLVFDANDSIIDGGTDTDTLLVDEDLDLTNLDDGLLRNIEIYRYHRHRGQ